MNFKQVSFQEHQAELPLNATARGNPTRNQDQVTMIAKIKETLKRIDETLNRLDAIRNPE